MKFFFDFLPVILFFIAYKGFDQLPANMISSINEVTGLGLDTSVATHAILFATLVAMLASLAQVLIHRIRSGKFERMHLITLLIILLAGGATLLLRDPIYFMWKPTIINGAFALAFLGSGFIGRKPLIQRMMGNAIDVPDSVWQRLNIAWALFFAFSAALNLFVAYGFSEEVWVNFKMFGLLGLTLVFILLQAIYLTRHLPEQTTEES